MITIIIWIVASAVAGPVLIDGVVALRRILR